MSKEAMKLALEALELNDAPLNNETIDLWERKTDQAITALREALTSVPDWANEALGKIKSARDCHPNAVDTLLFEAEEVLEEALAEQQEPVYHLRQYGDVTKDQLDRYMATGDINPQPAHRTWVELSDAETERFWEISRAAMPRYHTFKTLIEKALRERNT